MCGYFTVLFGVSGFRPGALGLLVVYFGCILDVLCLDVLWMLLVMYHESSRILSLYL